MEFARLAERAAGRARAEDEQRVEPLPVPGKRTLNDLRAAQSFAGLTASAVGKHSLCEAFAVQRFEDAPAEAAEIRVAAARGVATPSSPLPFLERIQRLFGRHDVSGIRAHLGGEAAASAAAMGARAFATENHVVLGDRADLFTVAHEAAHVVQQRAGIQLRDGVGSRGDRYERHADQVAERVVAGESAEALLNEVAAPGTGVGPAASPAVQRAPDYRDEDELLKMTLIQFDRYVHTQADWAVSDGVREQKPALRLLLGFARSNKGVVLGACRAYKVARLIELGVGQGGEADRCVMAYSCAASPRHRGTSIRIEAPATNLDELISLGRAILQLEAEIDKAVLARVIVERYDAAMLTQLVRANAVADFIRYYKTYQPQLVASNGKEIFAFLEFRTQGLGNMDTYRKVLPEIRNAHRFSVDVLRALCEHRQLAESGASTLPICVILQTSSDDSGAFAANPNLLALIERKTHLVLVAEGRDSVADFAKDLSKFAGLGKSKRIDELLLSAHGGTTTLKLAGKVGLTSNPKKQNSLKTTRAFFAHVKRLLRDDPSARLVLNGCLTKASNVPVLELSTDPDEAARQITEAMDASPNLTRLVEQVMHGHRAEVRGANASFPPAKVGLVKDGRLDLSSPEDAALTAPDKLTYVEHGMEPKGVLRATLEAWATDRKATIAALARRCEARGSDRSWPETVIRAVVMQILAEPDNAGLIQTMGKCADVLAKLRFRESCTVARLAEPALVPYRGALFEQLARSELWTNDDFDFVRLVVLQIWLLGDGSKAAELLQLLDQRFSLLDGADFIDLGHLLPFLDRLLAAPTPGVAPPGGPLLLALRYLDEQRENAPAAAKRYVATLVGPALAFPVGCGSKLKGTDERRILKYAGVLADAPAQAAPNVAPFHGRDNEVYVTSVTKRCIASGEVALYTLPSGDLVGEMNADVEMHVIGELTWTCGHAMQIDGGQSLSTNRQPGEQVALLAVEFCGPFPTVFIEAAAVKVY